MGGVSFFFLLFVFYHLTYFWLYFFCNVLNFLVVCLLSFVFCLFVVFCLTTSPPLPPHTNILMEYLDLSAGVCAEGFELHGGVHALSGVHEVTVEIRLHYGVQELELGVVAPPQNPLQQVASLEKTIKEI